MNRNSPDSLTELNHQLNINNKVPYLNCEEVLVKHKKVNC